MTEIWRPIPGHSGYEASSCGRVRSTDRAVPHGRGGTFRKLSGRVMSAFDNGRYLTIRVAGKTRLVHDLVLRAFSGPPASVDLECRHLNGNSRDNRSDNLAWGSRSQNQHDRFAHGTACEGEKNYRAKLMAADVKAIMRMRGSKSPTEISEALGCERHLVKHVIYGQSWNWLTGLPRNRSPKGTHRNGTL